MSAPHIFQAGNITFATLDIQKRDFDLFYGGFTNRALWPVCHYRLDLLQIDCKQTDGYFWVNRTFAEVLAPLLQPDDTIWIHDYHFIPLATGLRNLGVRNRIGFFLHIPWPPSDVANALPAYGRLLNALTAYDMAGLHTQQDADNFRQCLVREGIGFPSGRANYQVDTHTVDDWCQGFLSVLCGRSVETWLDQVEVIRDPSQVRTTHVSA